jgi:glycosyltransferase involved in cell wall biosynthesis
MVMVVAFVPYWGLTNPYQGALGKSLELFGVSIIKGELNDVFHNVIFKHLKIDVLHLHWLPPFKRAPARFFRLLLFVTKLLILRILGVRIVWTAHDLKPPESIFRQGDWLLAKTVIALANTVIVHSFAAQKTVISAFHIKNHKKIFVVPHGNFIAQYQNSIDRNSARSRLGITDSRLVILFLGKIRPYKGVLQLIDVFKTLRENVPDVELVIAGHPLNDNLADILREKIAGSENLQYKPGTVPADEIQVYMNASDVVVFPYLQILTSGAAVLAMSFARACIAPKLGGLQDTLDDNGAFLYEHNEKDGLLNALKAAYSNRDNLTSMGRHNLQKVLPLTWDYVACETYKVYSGL